MTTDDISKYSRFWPEYLRTSLKNKKRIYKNFQNFQTTTFIPLIRFRGGGGWIQLFGVTGHLFKRIKKSKKLQFKDGYDMNLWKLYNKGLHFFHYKSFPQGKYPLTALTLFNLHNLDLINIHLKNHVYIQCFFIYRLTVNIWIKYVKILFIQRIIRSCKKCHWSFKEKKWNVSFSVVFGSFLDRFWIAFGSYLDCFCVVFSFFDRFLIVFPICLGKKYCKVE